METKLTEGLPLKINQLAKKSEEMGLKVRTNLHAGNWACTDCTGKAQGNSLINAACEACYHQ